MERLAIFTTADGDEVVVQVADDGAPSAGLTTRGISTGRLIERTEQSLDEVLAHARPAVNALVRQMRGQDDAPDDPGQTAKIPTARLGWGFHVDDLRRRLCAKPTAQEREGDNNQENE